MQVYQGAALPPSCPPLTSLAFAGGSGLDAPAATCSTCSCGAPVGLTCSEPVATLFNSATCGGASCASANIGTPCAQVKTATQCTGAPGTQVYVSLASVAAGVGSCTASPETPDVIPASWATHVLGCAVTASPACGAGEVCTLPPANPFSLCIYQPGNGACPAGAYPTKSLVDTGVADGRSCTTCSCGAPSGTCSGGQIALSPNSACGSGTSNTVPSVCKFDGIPANLAYYAELVTAPTPDGCAPAGGQPVGSATPTGPITLCCQ